MKEWPESKWTIDGDGDLYEYRSENSWRYWYEDESVTDIEWCHGATIYAEYLDGGGENPIPTIAAQAILKSWGYEMGKEVNEPIITLSDVVDRLSSVEGKLALSDSLAEVKKPSRHKCPLCGRDVGRYSSCVCSTRVKGTFKPIELPPKPSDDKPQWRMWEPIETAPKDGTEILVCDVNHPNFMRLVYYYTTSGCWKDKGGRIAYMNDTHWMPLPNIPISKPLPEPLPLPPKPSDERLVDWGMMIDGECRVPVRGEWYVSPHDGCPMKCIYIEWVSKSMFGGRRWILITDPYAHAKQAFRDKELRVDDNGYAVQRIWQDWQNYNMPPLYDLPPENYSRKPKEVEKVVRVWTADEGLGKHIRPKVWSVSGGRVIISAGKRWVRIAQQTELINKGETPFLRLTYQEIKDNWIQTNGKPCGVEE